MRKRWRNYNVSLTVLLLVVTIWNISLSRSSQDDQDHDCGDGGRHMEDILVGVQEYGPGVWLGSWNRSIVSINFQLPYNTVWATLLTMLQLPAGCNAVDIGANDGDTSFNLAVATGGGSVVAFEMGPPIQLLRFNALLNPGLKVDIHPVAVSDKFEAVGYESGCNGCNGGISSLAPAAAEIQAVRLLPYLQQHYSQAFIDQICLVKIDTEGHDAVILKDMKNFSWRPPIMWIEWFIMYIFHFPLDGKKIEEVLNEEVLNEEVLKDDYCTPDSARLFRAALELGYEILEPDLPLRRVPGCANKHYTMDLLLVQRSLLLTWARDNNVDIPDINSEYHIVLKDGEGVKIETLRAGDGVTFHPQ